MTHKQSCRFFVLLGSVILAVLTLFATCERPEPEPLPPPEPGPEQPEVEWSDVTDIIPCWLFSMNSITLVNDTTTLVNMCPDAPAFDFTSRSLVIVSGSSTHGIINVVPDFYRDEMSQYHLTINVFQDYTCVPEGWRKYLIIPKVNNASDILLTINYCF